jgi:hypothetical protein
MPREPMKHEFMGHMLTVDQIARVTGRTKNAIRHLIRNGRLDRAGKDNPLSQEVMCEGKRYPSIARACRALGIESHRIYGRIRYLREIGSPHRTIIIDGMAMQLLPRRPKCKRYRGANQ